MGKVLLGGLMMVAGLFMSFIPPFVWGPPLFIVGLVMGAAGLFGTTVSAAKTVVSVSKELRGGPSSGAPGAYVAATPLAAQREPLSNADLSKWASLVELDTEIGEAAARARALGPGYEQLLAEKYLPLNDKLYLAAALNKVTEQATADAKAYEEKKNVDPKAIIQSGTYNGREFQLMGSGQYRCVSKINNETKYFDTFDDLKYFLD